MNNIPRKPNNRISLSWFVFHWLSVDVFDSLLNDWNDDVDPAQNPRKMKMFAVCSESTDSMKIGVTIGTDPRRRTKSQMWYCLCDSKAASVSIQIGKQSSWYTAAVASAAPTASASAAGAATNKPPYRMNVLCVCVWVGRSVGRLVVSFPVRQHSGGVFAMPM